MSRYLNEAEKPKSQNAQDIIAALKGVPDTVKAFLLIEQAHAAISAAITVIRAHTDNASSNDPAKAGELEMDAEAAEEIAAHIKTLSDAVKCDIADEGNQP